MSTDDMCIDYKKKFKIKGEKFTKGDFKLGLSINQYKYGTYYGYETERYLCLYFFKWCISIGWFIF